jgi:hypothetical protein
VWVCVGGKVEGVSSLHCSAVVAFLHFRSKVTGCHVCDILEFFAALEHSKVFRTLGHQQCKPSNLSQEDHN